MGTAVHFMDYGDDAAYMACDDDGDDDDCDDKDKNKHKNRLRIKVVRDEAMYDGKVVACGHAKWWKGNRDRVSGYVQEVVRGDDDTILGVIVLNTFIQLTDYVEPVYGAIGGIVFEDLNGDRVQNDGEPGIVGATVSLSGDAMAMATTDESGWYNFADLAAGDYVVNCDSIPGMVPTFTTEYTIMLEEGEVVDNANFSWMSEDQVFGAIAGIVFEDLNGNKALDIGEEGIAGIGVTLSGDAMTMATTDEFGLYNFADLAAGDYVVTCDSIPEMVSTTGNELPVKLLEGLVVDFLHFGWMEEAPALGAR